MGKYAPVPMLLLGGCASNYIVYENRPSDVQGNCWVLTDTSIWNERNGSGIWWRSKDGATVHVQKPYQIVPIKHPERARCPT